MTSVDEKLNSLDVDVKFWKGFSSYKKALYLTQNAPDCSFVISMDCFNSKTFPAHKSILESTSPVFQNIFNNNNNSNDIFLSNTEPQVFKKFLDFIYYGDDDNLRCVDASTLRKLISLAKKFKVDELIKTCVETMKQNLPNAENYDLINIFEYACLMEDHELIKECKRVIIGRAKSNHKFQDFNFNQQEEKRHIAQAKKQLSGGPNKSNGNFPEPVAASSNHANKTSTLFGKPAQPTASTTTSGGLNILAAPVVAPSSFTFGTSATPSVAPFGFSSTPTSQPIEEKLQNTDSNRNENVAGNAGNIFGLTNFPIGLNKGKITDCACIYNLNPSVFYELQITLSGFISELLRFNMIETYAKINGLIGGDDVGGVNMKDFAATATDPNVLNTALALNNVSNEAVKKEKDDSMPEFQSKANMSLSKQILNMLLRSIKFYRMTAKEFCSGPGKSSLLDMEEKYDLLVTIVNKN